MRNMLVDTLHLDMDGVIADFDGYIKKHTGMTCDELNSSVPSSWTHSNDDRTDPVYKVMKEHITQHDLFYEIDPMPDFSQWREVIATLRKNGFRVELLSAAPSDSLYEKTKRQKQRWVEKHFLEVDKIIVVPTSKFKHKYARQSSILVDDYELNVVSYIRGGGLGIHHKSLDETLQRLEYYFGIM